MHDNETLFQLEFIAPRARNSISYSLAKDCMVGSDEKCDVSLCENGILPFHAKIFVSDNELFIEPITNASLTVNGNRIDRALHLHSGDWVLFGSSPYQVKFNSPNSFVHTHGEKAEKDSDKLADGVVLAGKSRLTIGRQPPCDLEIHSPLLSRVHANLTKEPTGWFLEDCNSTNGTFINARRIQGKHPIQPQDRISFAVFEFVFDGKCLEPAKDAGQVRIEVQNIVKEVKDKSGNSKRLLNDISFAIESGEFVGIFGTSGSGKSTLLQEFKP
jgi:pSer/pThr/pTyr-binding forkhead associated (FHA) protein